MKRIRIGNDIWVQFAVMRDAQLEELPPVEQITVAVENISRWNEPLQLHNLTAAEGIVSFLIKGAETLDDENKYLGKYRITISYQLPDPSQTSGLSLHTLDMVAFELVQFSHLQGDTPHNCPELAVETVELTGNVATGKDGKSAYEVAVINGFVGTEQEWLESLEGSDGRSAYQSAIDGGLDEGIAEQEFNKYLATNSLIIGEALDFINGEGESNIVVAKLVRVIKTKKSIAEAIISKGEPVDDTDPFSLYTEKIKNLEGEVEAVYKKYGFEYAIGNDGALAEMARLSYEETKDWINYDKAGYNKKIYFVPLLDMSSVTDAYTMFSHCTALIAIPQLDTSSVTDASAMFRYCSALISIPPLNTSNVTKMSYMFNSCRSLVSLSTLDTSSVTDLEGIFQECEGLVSLPLLDTSNVTRCGNAFYKCTNLKNLGGFKNLKASLDLDTAPKLTVESLENVINHLFDLTGQTSEMLALGVILFNKLTNEQKAIAVNKNWTLSAR